MHAFRKCVGSSTVAAVNKCKTNFRWFRCFNVSVGSVNTFGMRKLFSFIRWFKLNGFLPFVMWRKKLKEFSYEKLMF